YYTNRRSLALSEPLGYVCILRLSLCRVIALWAALADQQETDALQQLDRRVHPFGQEDISLRVPVINSNFTGEQNSGSFGRDGCYFLDKLCPMKAWHHQVREHEIDSTLLESLERLLGPGTGEYTLAARFKQDLANGEGLLIVVDAKDSSFRFHRSRATGDAGLSQRPG